MCVWSIQLIFVFWDSQKHESMETSGYVEAQVYARIFNCIVFSYNE